MLYRSICVLLCLTTFLPLLNACGAVSDTLSANEITQQLAGQIEGSSSYILCSERYLSANLGLKSPFPEHSCMRDANHSVDEFGVFACDGPTEAVALKNSLNATLEKRKREFDDRYFSEEQEKIETATAVARGRYVLYTILAPDLQSLVIEQFYHILKGNTLSYGTQTRYQGQTNVDG